MKTFAFLIILLTAGPAAVFSQQVFDLGQDHVAVQVDTSVFLTVSEQVLVHSVQNRVPNMGAVQSVSRKRFGQEQFLVFEALHATRGGSGIVVGIRLQPDAQGRYFAEKRAVTCEDPDCNGCTLVASNLCGGCGNSGDCAPPAVSTIQFNKVPLENR
jgi:hypothetical protein